MRLLAWVVGVANILGLVYGVYSELAPQSWPLGALPEGMGLGLSLISATMGLTVLLVEQERQERTKQADSASAWERVAETITAILPVHERDFYSLWPAQVRSARYNVDVTHLGPRPPKKRHGMEEKYYYDSIRELFANCTAHVRRVERYTTAKKEYLSEMATQFSGVDNFSLRALKDPSTEDMPFALSVSRVDDRFAWIVAMAEHESTTKYRDLMVTGRDSVDLLSRYFQNRLWERSITILENGELNAAWESELAK